MLTMNEAIAKQIPLHEQRIWEHANTVKTYLQSRMDDVAKDPQFICALEQFLLRIPDYYNAPLNGKLTRCYNHGISQGWVYNTCGYLEKSFYDVPESVMEAYHNGFLLAGFHFGDEVKGMTLSVQGEHGEVLLDTQLQLIAYPAYSDSLFVMEMVEGINNPL